MSVIILSRVSFQYEASTEPVFRDCSMSINSSWKTGIVGRNGRGKSTLLQLIHGAVQPNAGIVECPLRTGLFPFAVADANESVFEVIKQSIAPYRKWETVMECLLKKGDDASLTEYYILFEQYSRQNGFSIDAKIVQESSEIGINEQILSRPFAETSGGEQTRALIAALFLRSGIFPLLDEPTNHLDLKGRSRLAEYLSRKKGFIVVSHDRNFLDNCCDHIVAINKNDLRVFQGNYSRWRDQMALEERSESARNETLMKEIASLETAARQRRSWSMATEREKNKAFDSGFVSHKAAKMMKRALASEQRMDDRIQEKRALLRNKETVRQLPLHTEDSNSEILISLENVTIEVGGRILLRNFSMTVRRHERIALIGMNGSGKTTLLNVIRRIHPLTDGICRVPGNVKMVHGFQIPQWNSGLLRKHLIREGFNEMIFRTTMGIFNIQGEIFERPLETFSYGERKKVDLCRSFIVPHHLLVWDEPVNYIDIESKEQIESLILTEQPTMLFVEHDKAFIESIATSIIQLPSE